MQENTKSEILHHMKPLKQKEHQMNQPQDN
jgi:hypothetical protein